MIELILINCAFDYLGLNIKGCFNIQFAIQGDDLYVLEVNPRSSRTVPFVAKSSGLPLAKIAANVTTPAAIIKLDIIPSCKGRSVTNPARRCPS